MITNEDCRVLHDKQQAFFLTGKTLPIAFRIEQLKKIKSIIQSHQADIVLALQKDLHRPEMESILLEIFLVRNEIDYILKHLKAWVKPKRVSTAFPFNWVGKSKMISEPYGSVLIISPWNYPFILFMSPLIGAIAAGNCAVLKPSEIAPHTQTLFQKLINDYFPPEYLVVVEGGPEEATALLQQKWDYLFFTGGPQIGQIIMEAAAKNLTPLTLELGGKNPCIVDEDANLDFAANRIVWAKTVNMGQTCLAPDFLLVHASVKDALVKKMMAVIKQFYGDDPQQSMSYCRIINKKHFERISHLMESGRIIFGGEKEADNLFIAPTLIDEVNFDDPIMQEEIFGPLLPIMTFDDIHSIIPPLKKRPKSLALYIFTRNQKHENLILNSISFGGGCVNDCMTQTINYYMPFGGVGMSGMGGYHGEYSFNTFSHLKSIYRRKIPLQLGIDQPPYTPKKLVWLRRIFRI